ncbi:transposase for insertion sequence [Corynebacterium humireducens NBRC 106098 = DSM 45392]|uniref:Transposase for insertion sequence n=1 Tax=Corynebacterium humireducens NBRC 106098 = DSM 45392 TaxID=1223515 RepID=A0A0B5DCF2_9CORY|nr:transposase for insertion sequence [Corynebacterium humireducens NBRC 106098 = DSM 45392]
MRKPTGPGTLELPSHLRGWLSQSNGGNKAVAVHTWLDSFGTGTKTNANGEKVASPVAAANSARTPAEGLSDTERIRVLERENAKLREEREILRKAAKYFAEETNW